jgi:hypothetical protein
MRAFIRRFFVLCAVCVFTLHLQAQFETGSIVGTIRDSSGAVLSGASVRVANLDTGIAVTRVTDENGNYEVVPVRVGHYSILVSKEGFADAKAENIGVVIASRQRVDLMLAVGAVQTSLVVHDVALQLETETSQRGQIVTQYETASLPLVGRNYSSLIGLTTGVRATSNGLTTASTNNLVREGSFNVNGQRSMFNNFLLDGMDNNAGGTSNQGFSNQIIDPAPDSVAQFQVVTNNQSAEYGRGSGATINVAFASGTNAFHGRVYEFLRNTDLNAIGYFKPAQGKPQFNRNQFGGNFGGPVLHNQLFFFMDYEGFRQVRKQNNTATLFTANERDGIFTSNMYDPYDGTLYTAGTSILSSSHISPLALQILSYLPATNASTSSYNYKAMSRSRDFLDKGDVRLDWTPDAVNSFFVRGSEKKENAIFYPLLGLPLDGGSDGRTRIMSQQVALGWTRTLGASRLLEARLGLSRTRAGKYSMSIGDTTFTIPGLPTDPTVAGGLPTTSFSGGWSQLGRLATNPQWQNPAILNPKINYAWSMGTHSLKTGYEYQRIWVSVQDTNPLYGAWGYQAGFSALAGGKTPTSESYVADFLWGAPAGYSLSSFFVGHINQSMHFAYIQDDWKVTPKLTLNLGMRYEYGTPYWEKDNLQSNFDPDTLTMKIASDDDKYLVPPDRNDFAPRIGFAYALNNATVVRGGYGVGFSHYDRPGSGNLLALNAPQALFVTVTQYPGTISGGSNATFRTMDDGFSTDALVFNQLTANVTYIPEHYGDSYVYSYFLSVQRSLMKNALIDVAYVGNHGLKLLEFANANQKNPANGWARPYPTWGDITIAMKDAYSHYDAFQVRYEQQAVAGLTLLNSFTWSHARDNAGAALESSTPSPQNYYDLAADYGQSDYNQPFVNTTALVYELPFGKGRKWLSGGGVVNTLLGGWQISAINQAASGYPFNLTYSPSTSVTVSSISASYRGANLYRPNRVSGQPLTKLVKSGNTVQYVNLSAVEIPSATAVDGVYPAPFGDMSRNPARSPAIDYTNISLNKTFPLPAERMKMEFRGELNNVFNHTNFSTPSTSMSGTAGSVATKGGGITTTFDPRIIQFGLKVLF